jgi:predicted dienelactone hydrolase
LSDIILTIDANYFVGSKRIRIIDEIDSINFETWLLYPSTDKSQNIKIGPYSINASPDGKMANGRFPLVIISHGGGGSHLLYRVVAQHLAQNGYVVAMPEHYGNNRNDNSLEGQNKNFPPSQDPDGFDREAFHETLKAEVLVFFNKQLKIKAIIGEKSHNKANSADAKSCAAD